VLALPLVYTGLYMRCCVVIAPCAVGFCSPPYVSSTPAPLLLMLALPPDAACGWLALPASQPQHIHRSFPRLPSTLASVNDRLEQCIQSLALLLLLLLLHTCSRARAGLPADQRLLCDIPSQTSCQPNPLAPFAAAAGPLLLQSSSSSVACRPTAHACCTCTACHSCAASP
jgi:hypothetical protein